MLGPPENLLTVSLMPLPATTHAPDAIADDGGHFGAANGFAKGYRLAWPARTRDSFVRRNSFDNVQYGEGRAAGGIDPFTSNNQPNTMIAKDSKQAGQAATNSDFRTSWAATFRVWLPRWAKV